MTDKAGQFFRFHSAPGHSDLAGCLRPSGRAWYIEVKVPGKHPTEAQQAFLDAMSACGAIAGCAHSVDEALELLGYRHG